MTVDVIAFLIGWVLAGAISLLLLYTIYERDYWHRVRLRALFGGYLSIGFVPLEFSAYRAHELRRESPFPENHEERRRSRFKH